MRHITMAEKSLLIGDEAAGALVEYAALMARLGSGDTVALRAISADGQEVEATFLLNSGTVLMSESSMSTLPEPDNGAMTALLRERLESYDLPDAASAASSPFGSEPTE